ncbi:hypothetical protein BH20ACT6_BH20ACT6_12160 [soil metagenome]
MSRPSGFASDKRGDTVVVRHHGRHAATLRGDAAQKFLVDVETTDPQAHGAADRDLPTRKRTQRQAPPAQHRTLSPVPAIRPATGVGSPVAGCRRPTIMQDPPERPVTLSAWFCG